MDKKKILAMMAAGILLTGCGVANSTNGAASTEDKNENVTEEIKETEKAEETKEPETTETPELQGEIVSKMYGNDFSSWKEGYADFIKNQVDTEELPDMVMGLIYLDDDDVPELYINTNMGAGGEIVASFKDGKVSYNWMGGDGFSYYMPEKALFYQECGRMGCYNSSIYKLVDGDFYEIAGGYYELKDAFADMDDESSYIYRWMDKECSKTEYYNQLDKVFNRKKGIEPQNLKSEEEMLKELK